MYVHDFSGYLVILISREMKKQVQQQKKVHRNNNRTCAQELKKAIAAVKRECLHK